jgi:hypothetical protein
MKRGKIIIRGGWEMRNKQLFIIFLMLFCLTSCGKIDEQTQAVINDIQSIGEVDLNDGILISKIEDEYTELSSEQKKKVSNIDTWYEAKKTFDRLEKETPFPFSSVNWDTKKTDIYKVMGRKPDEEGKTDSGDYSYYYKGIKYEGYSAEVNYLYNNDSLIIASLILRDVDNSDFQILEKKLEEKYGNAEGDGVIRTWYSDNLNIELNGAVLGFNMLKVTYIKP